MSEHILFLTGKLAEKRLHAVLASMSEPGFRYSVRNIGVNVASLMTAGMIERRLDGLEGIDRIIVPGLCRGNLDELSGRLGVPISRGSDDLKDLPGFFGRPREGIDLDQHDVHIFAEIVDAAEIDENELLARARAFSRDGADVIDIGCLPDTPFPQLEEYVRLLKSEGFLVSIDSMDTDELYRGARAGADYMLSLKTSTLWLAEEVDAIPVIIPEHHPDPATLYQAIDRLLGEDRKFIADSILDPVHFGFTESITRYSELRQRYPQVEIMMGTGNLTELTEADTSGINAMLFGIISELGIENILATQVSAHACTAIREADRARRIFFAARHLESLPKGIDDGLMTTHERKPFPYTGEEISELAGEIRDPSYRVQVSEDAIHVFNRDGLVSGTDPYTLFPQLDALENDPAHAFYMGVELARARIALQLGKRYTQDLELDWGVAARSSIAAEDGSEDSEDYKAAGSTLEKRNKTRKQK